MEENESQAPGRPGIEPRWTASAKSGVGTALNTRSRVWFTLSHGIFNEIYFPRVDRACTRDMGMIVTDGREFFSEEKRHADHEVEYLADGVLGYRLINTCCQKRYRIEKEIVADPKRDSVLQRTRFIPLQGSMKDYHLYVLLAPHLDNQGCGNTAWRGEYKGVPMLFARRGGVALALACSVPWVKRSVGFVGVSDGWQDLMRHKRMEWTYARADNGNVALIGKIDLQASSGCFTLVIGFGVDSAEAGYRARSSILDGFDAAESEYMREWQAWQRSLFPVEAQQPREKDLYRISMMVMNAHEAKSFQGGIIASLSVPWGFSRGDDDLGGYHLVWPRDLVEAAGGLLAGGGKDDARRVLHYLWTTQEPNGRWAQNMWMSGSPYWDNVQLDGAALPILLVDLVRREGGLGHHRAPNDFWPMVRSAAGYIVRNGPTTKQDRWEEASGYTPFTLAAEIAALLIAADLADETGEPSVASYLRETADAWNDCIEEWIYARGTELADRLGIEGYYVRIAPSECHGADLPLQGRISLANHVSFPPVPVVDILSPDALALVRFGLRAPGDPRIVGTVKAIDALLKVENPYGPAWHRYPGDGYGEHKDGAPFDGTGIGRAWPLLTGERAHYELASGRRDVAQRLLRTMEDFANPGGMIPEQIWDAPDIPGRGLTLGRPSGSAMPLVWAHAEYVKLRRSLHDGRIFDMPPQTVQRYILENTVSPMVIWSFKAGRCTMPAGKTLRVEALATARIRWSTDDWTAVHDTETRNTGLGVHIADLPTDGLPPGATVCFTFYWPLAGKWEGVDYRVKVVRAMG